MTTDIFSSSPRQAVPSTHPPAPGASRPLEPSSVRRPGGPPASRAAGDATPVAADTPPGDGSDGAFPRIAVYVDPQSAPIVVTVADHPITDESLPLVIETIAGRAHGLARDQGGRLPLTVFRELVANLVHASFEGVTITILDAGNTVRVSDRGPGIPDKEAALKPGFTSADTQAKRFIRGVGSGLAVVRQTLAAMGGTLEIEDNLGRGTVVTARVAPLPDIPLAPARVPSYNLPERQLKTLLLTVELAPVGPTRLAKELGVSTSTAYRDLMSLETAGLVTPGQGGHRSVTDEGLAYLGSVL